MASKTQSRARGSNRTGRTQFDQLPTEIIQKIYAFATDIDSVINLSYTSHFFQNAFTGSQKLNIIESVLEAQFGPLHDIVQLLTFNASQPAHYTHKPGMSIALAQQIVKIGRVAARWAAIYPTIRWREASELRRHLRPHEVTRLYRALYRLWFYNKAFDSSQRPGLELNLVQSQGGDQRLQFLRQFNNLELVEMMELHDVLFEMVCHDICPSNAMIQQRYSQDFCTKELLYFGSYETRTIFFREDDPFRQKVPLKKLPNDLVLEAWGGSYTQLRSAKDIMKLTPDTILIMKEDYSCKAERVDFLRIQPECFHDNPSTLRTALYTVAEDRDYDLFEYHELNNGIVDPPE